VTARTTTQGLVGYLLGSTIGALVYTLFAQYSQVSLWFTFLVFAGTHLICSFKALRSVCFTTLNQQRLIILVDQFFIPTNDHTDKFLHGPLDNPEELQRKEREYIVLTPKYLRKPPRIVLGSTIESAFQSQQELSHALEIFGTKKYIVNLLHGKVHVLLRDTAESVDIIEAYFFANHVCKIVHSHTSMGTEEIIHQAVLFTESNFEIFLKAVEGRGWQVNKSLLAPHQVKVSWK